METEPAAKQQRTGNGREGGGLASTISDFLAEVVEIKEERLDEATHRHAQDAATIQIKAQEVAAFSPSPTVSLNALAPCPPPES